MAKAVFERSNPPLYRIYDGDVLTMKRCAKCEQHKKVSEFQRDASRKDKYTVRCKACNNKRRHNFYVEKERTPERAARLKAIEADPDLRKKEQRHYDAKYKARMRARTLAEIDADQKRHHPTGLKTCGWCSSSLPLSMFSRYKASYDGLHAKCKVCDTARRLKIDVSRLLMRWEDLGLYACVYCDAPYEDIEHTIPRAQGGTDHIENLVPACQECNRGPGGKHARTPAEWRPEQHAEMRTIIGRLQQMQD